MKQVNSDTINKVKKYVNKKIVLGILAVVMCIGVIVVSSIFPLIIDFSQIRTTTFLSNELIIIAITIFSLIAFMFIAQASNEQTSLSKLAVARTNFKHSLELVEQKSINGFIQWVKKVFEKEEIDTIQRRELRTLQIYDERLLQLSDEEIESLTDKPQKINGNFYKALTKEQVKSILDIKRVAVHFVSPDYYLTSKTIEIDKTITERAGNEGKKKSLTLLASLGSKIILTLVVNIIMGALVYDAATGRTSAEILSNLVSRLFAMVSSGFAGFLVGVQMNDIDASYIDMRCIVHKRYLDDKDFKIMTYEEEAKQDFKVRVQKENEDTMRMLDNKSNQIEMKKE